MAVLDDEAPEDPNNEDTTESSSSDGDGPSKKRFDNFQMSDDEEDIHLEKKASFTQHNKVLV